ncbi:LINE-1 retrotransposable element ORF2 protein [Cucumis melo var. makuwa]|uniref:LINE-1 retrotransposable element ORF2 protein n=1 Tax=Cucumis melo var. makuwa TaxID=1194695 RepID=A0A5A7VF18_CUCMM|nr:LINE-1 retrotransposable element ORF2 protein [Cucumis melo var. makuwa]TYK15123.1 LINE-1 retrotransposable element ORF2 protein [Cucumis melo var. makuwa]
MAKAIANRLKSTLPITISPNQLAFVRGRQITDVILMANEAVISGLQVRPKAASGLTINRSKSSITLVNIPTNRSAEVANLWNFPTRPFPIDYLGVPLGGKPNSKGFWTNIVDKIQKKLNGWKYSQLSKGGKLTLIQASLSSLPTYQLSVFKAPNGVGKSIEKCWRDFLWKNKNDSKCTNLVRWSIVTTPKCKRGLGITNVKDTNIALLCKWLWRFQEEKDSLWVKLISVKYKGHHIGDIPTKRKYSNMKTPWRQIIKGIGWFENHWRWKINEGKNLSFWLSNWTASGPLSSRYPRLYAFDVQKVCGQFGWNEIAGFLEMCKKVWSTCGKILEL